MLKGLIITVARLENEENDPRTCDISLWLHKLVEIWLDKGEPLLDAASDVSTTLADITNHCIAMSAEYIQTTRACTHIVLTSKDLHRLR